MDSMAASNLGAGFQDKMLPTIRTFSLATRAQIQKDPGMAMGAPIAANGWGFHYNYGFFFRFHQGIPLLIRMRERPC